MKTAEEFIREKIREKGQIKGSMDALWKYQVSGEDCLRWAHEYAKQQSIEFGKWVAKNGYYARLNGLWEVNILGEDVKPITSEQLYELFLNPDSK